MEKPPEKKYNVLDTTLQNITKTHITLSEEETKQYNKKLREIFEAVVAAMKEADPIFKCMYQNVMYTGSFYENLRISKPDEFDINLIFQFPASSVKIEYNNNQPGFVKVKINKLDVDQIVKRFNEVPKGKEKLEKWIGPDGYLQRDKFIQWMQGVAQRAVQQLDSENIGGSQVNDLCQFENTVAYIYNGLTIRYVMSGPAVTLEIKTGSQLSDFSIDLVPVFMFGKDKWPPHPVRKPIDECQDWCIVPKAPLNNKDAAFWRMSFYKQEKKIMNNLNSMKHIIKLMKEEGNIKVSKRAVQYVEEPTVDKINFYQLLRDSERWKKVSSYALKTLFMWEHEKESDKQFWKKGIGFLYVHMLRKFGEYISSTEGIPFYWDKRLDLLQNVNSSTRKNWGDRIQAILKSIDRHLQDNPQHIEVYFRPPNSQENEASKSPEGQADKPSSLRVEHPTSKECNFTIAQLQDQDKITAELSSLKNLVLKCNEDIEELKKENQFLRKCVRDSTLAGNSGNSTECGNPSIINGTIVMDIFDSLSQHPADSLDPPLLAPPSHGSQTADSFNLLM